MRLATDNLERRLLPRVCGRLYDRLDWLFDPFGHVRGRLHRLLDNWLNSFLGQLVGLVLRLEVVDACHHIRKFALQIQLFKVEVQVTLDVICLLKEFLLGLLWLFPFLLLIVITLLRFFQVFIFGKRCCLLLLGFEDSDAGRCWVFLLRRRVFLLLFFGFIDFDAPRSTLSVLSLVEKRVATGLLQELSLKLGYFLINHLKLTLQVILRLRYQLSKIGMRVRSLL